MTGGPGGVVPAAGAACGASGVCARGSQPGCPRPRAGAAREPRPCFVSERVVPSPAANSRPPSINLALVSKETELRATGFTNKEFGL